MSCAYGAVAMDEKTDEITFQENASSDDEPRRSLRARLGWLGFTVTFVAVVVLCFALGAGVSILAKRVAIAYGLTLG